MTGPGELTLGSYNVWIHAARNTAQQVALLRREGSSKLSGLIPPA